jgi:hypothetical protein
MTERPLLNRTNWKSCTIHTCGWWRPAPSLYFQVGEMEQIPLAGASSKLQPLQPPRQTCLSIGPGTP